MTSSLESEPQLVDPEDSEEGNPRLDHWLERTTTPLDLLALCTIWITVIPIGDIHKIAGHPFIWYIIRILLTLIYGTDMVIRTKLAKRKVHYVVRHPLMVIAVVIPAVRVIFSIRLLRSMFRTGALSRFLFVAFLLSANLTVIVFGFEHRADGANITTIGDAIWWACVTLATVGYGDFSPVTVGGRISAVVLMVVGLITVAVITANIASSFMDQAAARRAALAAGGVVPAPVETPQEKIEHFGTELSSSIDERLARIEALLNRQVAAAPPDQT